MTPLRRLLAAAATASALALVGACGSSEPASTSSEPTAQATPDGSQATDDDADADTGADTGTETGSGTDTDELTMADVEANSTPDSCWTAIDGTVYDLTEWIGSHPGGTGPIEGLCGTDGTAQFTAQHGGQDQPGQRLEQLEIGELAD